MLERFDQAYSSVAAHAQVTNIIEKNDSGRCRPVNGLKQNGAYYSIVAARLTNNRGSQFIMIVSKNLEPFSDWAVSEIWKTVYDDTRWFTAGMRINRPNSMLFTHKSIKT
jgi:hypothetical protein